MMKLFVWDFHGVLEKDNDLAVLEISNSILADAGFSERFSEEDNKNYYGIKWFQYFERLLPHLTTAQHMDLQAACFRYAEENLGVLSKYIKPNDNALEVLRAINKAGHDQILLSNTRPHDLIWFVNEVGISSYFPVSKIFGVNAHEHLGSKKEALKHYLEGKSFSDIVIIGDSETDMELGKVAGGVTYFYRHHHLKLAHDPQADYLITDLKKVLKEL